MKVAIPPEVKVAADVVKRWLAGLQEKYDPNLANAELMDYYNPIQTMAEEKELEWADE